MAATLTFAPLPSRALIAVGGAAWRDFLQNLLTQDVERLEAGEARFAALLTPQGRVLHDLFVVGREDGCWLDVAAEARAAAIQRLMIYRLRAKVEIAADDTPVSALFSSHGQGNPSSDPPRGPPSPARGEGVWIQDPRLPELGWRGYGTAAPPGARRGHEGDYEAHRLALGVPGAADWGSDRSYPIEANFDLLGGIDFQKGCFVGQETTSRMKRRGQVKSRMLPIVFEGPPPEPGAEVLAGERRAGEVLSAIAGRGIALLRLDRIEGATLKVSQRPVQVERPAWFEERLHADNLR